MRINVLHAARAKLVVGTPGHEDVTTAQRRHGRVDLHVVGEGIDQHIVSHPDLARREEPGVDMLKTLAPALPDKGRPATVQQRHLRALLIPRADGVHPKGRKRPGEAAVQLQRADSQAVAISNSVLPNQVAARRTKGELGFHLVRGQCPGDGVFDAVGEIVVGLGQKDAGGGDGHVPADQRAMSEL